MLKEWKLLMLISILSWCNITLSQAETIYPQLAMGSFQIVALKSDGTVDSWGKFNVPNIPTGLRDVVAVSAGGALAAMAVKSDGTLVGWGNLPTMPAGLKDIIAVSIGSGHVLALKLDGTVVAWGNQRYGQSRVPAGLNNLVAIVASGQMSMALKSDGTVVAWGRRAENYPTNLTNVVAIAKGMALKSDGTVVSWGATNIKKPVPAGLNNAIAITEWEILKSDGTVVSLRDFTQVAGVAMPAGLNGVVHIASALYKTVALKEDGTIVIWGMEVGGVDISSQTPMLPQLLQPRTIVKPQLSAGAVHTAVLKADGTVASWGINYSGQTDVPVGLSGVVAVSAGGMHTVALRADGRVVIWGDDSSGQSTVPAGLNNNIIAVSAGMLHTAAIQSNGKVIAWGDNRSGQTKVPVGLNNVVAIATGYDHTVALKANGTVVAWGNNSFLQTTVPAGLSNVIAIDAGASYTVALTSFGKVVAWGADYSGQSTVPLDLTDVVAIDAGNFHVTALKLDGTVVQWGESINGTTIIPTGLSRVKAISGGGNHTIAFKSDGTVVTWGSGSVPPLNLGLLFHGLDSDSDGIANVADAFPTDAAASQDDGDGYPDVWNIGKTSANSSSVPALQLDLFPNDSTRWFDNIAPVITNTPANKTMQATGVMTSVALDVQPTATDASAVIFSHNGALNYPVGSTVVTWTASDSYGNQSTTQQHVIIQDTIAPTITLHGSADVYIEAGHIYVDAGATSWDAVGGTSNIVATGTINALQVGTYQLTYQQADAAGNVAKEARRIHVQDTTAPVFATSLLADVTIEAMAAKNMVMLTPPNANDLSAFTISNNAPATYAVGSTAITWVARDEHGNQSAVIQQVVVQDTLAPVITLAGLINVYVEVGGIYTDAGATSWDAVDGTTKLIATGLIDTTQVGKYKLAYHHTDAAGNVASSVFRNIIVQKKAMPDITAANSAAQFKQVPQSASTTSPSCLQIPGQTMQLQAWLPMFLLIVGCLICRRKKD